MTKRIALFPEYTPQAHITTCSTTTPLTASPSLFTQLYENLAGSGQGIWAWKPLAKVLHFNKTYMQMLGYDADVFTSHISTFENLLHPEDKEDILSAQYKVVTSAALGESFESRFRLRMKNGQYRWVIGKGFVVHRDEQAQATLVVGIHIDSLAVGSSLKQHLTAHDRMHFALEAANDGLWDWDAQTNSVYYSPRYLEMLGYTPKNFLPVLESWTSRVHPEDLAHTVEMQMLIAASPAYGDVFECIYRFLTADGTYRWILGRGKVTRRDEQGRASRIVGLHTDITELRTTQEALAKIVNVDRLTQLYSRFYFEREMGKLRPAQHPISLIYGDVDCLKLVNDHIGHQAGDALLATAGQLVRATIRSTDVAARLGGDEFIILLPRCPEDDARKVLNKILTKLNEYNALSDSIPVFISMGLVSAEQETPQHTLIARADKMMMADKARHRTEHRTAMKKWLENTLHTSIDATDLRL
ncbi:MAG: PAS domain-containing protein [Desulfovibrionaceae bacterium]